MNYVYNIGNIIIERFFPCFKGNSSDIWKACPNQMLWEAILKNDTAILGCQSALDLLAVPTNVYVLPEFLPALYMGVTPAYQTICSTSLLEPNSLERKMLNIEPLYVVNCDFSWMLVFTTENTPSGDQLCGIIKNW